MNKIKFVNDDNIYTGEMSLNGNIVRLYIANMPSSAYSGFYLLNEYNAGIMGDYTAYTTKYKDSDEEDVIYISTGEIYVKAEPTPEPTEEEIAEKKKLELESVKSNKIAELSAACNAAIEAGIEINGKKYSYTVQDQSDMRTAINLAKETGMEVPYHADGESCSLYDYATITSIYIQEIMNLTVNQTYFNQFKLYIESIKNTEKIDDIKAIKYGDELTGEYLDKYNEILLQSQKIVEKVVALNS